MVKDSLLPSGMLVMGSSFIFFRLLNSLVQRLPVPIGAQETRRKTWTYWNILVSFTHSFITACLSLYCFFDEPAMLTDMIYTWSSLSYYLVAFSNGYFVHDFLDILINDWGRQIPLVLHHIVVLTAYSIALFHHKYVAFALVSLLLEVNSVFLHMRKILLSNGYEKDSTVFKINGVFLLITFINFRLLTSAWMTNFIVTMRHSLPAIHFIFALVGMAIISGLNVGLLLILWKSDFRRDQKNSP